MKLKSGVSIKLLQPQIVLGIMIIEPVFKDYGTELTITCGSNGKHKVANSLHYQGLAIDIRSHDIKPSLLHMVLAECRARLGVEFDFILEDEGTPDEHFHMEFQPKN